MALVRPTAARRRRLAKLAAAHRAWTAEQRTPAGDLSDDANEHATTVYASPEAEADFQKRARDVLGR